MKLTIGAVPISMIEIVWDKCTPHLDRVVQKSRNEISLETIKDNIMNGGALMVTVSDGSEVIAVNILETCTYATGFKVLLIPIIGGSRLTEWQDDFLDVAHAIARDLDCKELRGMARPGWLKVLKKYGWSPAHTIITVPVKQASNITDINCKNAVEG